MRVNLGCGLDVLKGWVNVDLVPALDGVGTVDLDHLWPWFDQEVSEFRAIDVFEHVANPIHFMCEAHRCLKDGGTIRIQTCNAGHWTAYADPTHRRYLHLRSFDYWIPGTEFYQQNPMYGGVAFAPVEPPYVTETHQIMVVLRRA